MAEKSILDWEFWPKHQKELREFRWGKVYELIYSNRPCLMVVVQGDFYGTLYTYFDGDEFEMERLKVLNFGDGMAGAGVPAPDRPNPPTRTDALAFAEPIGAG